MPKRAQEQHENDDGFVEDAPQSKKAKNAGANPSKKSAISPLIQVDDEGNDYWELSDTRRVGVSTYKGMTLINIREYYEKDGKSLPGRKAGTDMLPEEEAEEVGEVAEEEQDVKPSKRKLDKKLKANHETTSDEDEDEG
ncbi:hypothetical protein LTR87_011149 [Friedmanniomyces endolithicus]|nr:hypothetical protein LTR87_011149 [Friedmanniomyces endolithicus]